MEIFLGYNSLRTGADRTRGRVKHWGSGEDVNTVTLAYLPGEYRLRTTVESPVSGVEHIVFCRLSSSALPAVLRAGGECGVTKDQFSCAVPAVRTIEYFTGS